jgi:GNAT superfamily N-acetyltransferase
MRILQAKRGLDRPLQQRLIQLAQLEGWNPCIDDLNYFNFTDPSAFFFALPNGCDEDDDETVINNDIDPNKAWDRVVSCVGGLIIDDNSAFVLYYLCLPEHRGNGYGLAVFNAAMRRLGSHRNVGLDAVLKQVPNYKKQGFKECWRNFMMRGQIPSAKERLNAIYEIPAGVEVRMFDAAKDLQDILAFDRRNYGGLDRGRFLSALLTARGCLSGVAAVVARRAGELVGFACLRPGVDMLRVGYASVNCNF